jgi:hypothetical protein
MQALPQYQNWTLREVETDSCPDFQMQNCKLNIIAAAEGMRAPAAIFHTTFDIFDPQNTERRCSIRKKTI